MRALVGLFGRGPVLVAPALLVLGLGTLSGFGVPGWLGVREVLVACGLVGGLVCLAQARRGTGEDLAWSLIGLGVLALAFSSTLAGDASVQGNGADAAAVLWLFHLPLLGGGVVLLARERLGHLPLSLWLDGLIGALGIMAVVSVIAPGSGTPIVALGQSAVLGLVVGMAASGVAVDLRDWLIGAAIAVIVGAELIDPGADSYSAAVALGTAATLIAIAAESRPAPGATRHPAIAFATSLALAAVSLGILAGERSVSVPGVTSVLAAACLSLLLVRVAVTFTAERRLIETLRERADRDPLTGLLNHRRFHEELATRIAAAGTAPITLALIDLDNFKQINDQFGHQVGDSALRACSSSLREVLGDEGAIARVGGDELAAIIGADADAAESVLSGLGHMVADEPHGLGLTLSIGLCDTHRTLEPEELIRFADGALYWAKSSGRNQMVVYDPEVVTEFSIEERAARLERSRTMLGLSALARAIDAKDHSTHAHAERVAALASDIAGAIGWSASRCRELYEAARFHDVGKIGVPDAILLKDGRLRADEYARIKEHAALGEAMTDGVLTVEQRLWIRHHHERYDGGGYPDALQGDAIPDGARIIAVADAYDVMTVARAYSSARTPAEAVRELRAGAGSQFDPYVVEAAATIVGRGASRGS